MTDEQPVLYEENNGIVLLTLNLPERRNPITGRAMIDALCHALSAADANHDIGAVILTGAGTAFSSGGDLNHLMPGGQLRDSQPVVTRRNYSEGIQRLPRLLQEIDVPLIAAVNGPAIGAGCDLACMCDIRVAAENACFAESFVRLGLIPGDGGAWVLPRIVGYPKAIELALTGRQIDAAEALACGLVSIVVPSAELMETALSTASQITRNPPHAVRLTKRLLRQAQTSTLSDALEVASAYQALAHATPDHEKALLHHMARRT